MLLSYHITSTSSGYIGVQLYAERGPLKTSNFSIGLEVVAIEKDATFVHLSYSYSYGMSGRVAMQAYLLTSGQGKEGLLSLTNKPMASPIMFAVCVGWWNVTLCVTS